MLQQLELLQQKFIIRKMSEDKMEHQDDPKGASRRSRKDEQGRDYVCGCGKRYLSYPALYTHIKTKHDGHQPEGTQKTGVTAAIRRPKQKVDDRVLKQIQNLVQISDLKILTQLDENALGSIPLLNRIKKQYINKQLFQTYTNLIRSNCPISLDKKSSLQLVLIIYLIGVGQYTSQSMFLYYCHFAKHFRNCFHQHAQEIYQSCFKTEDNRKEKVLNVQECRMAPIICDFFLRFFIPYESKDMDYQNVMELICCDFCNWLYQNKLTIVEISMKKNYQISKRNLIQPKSKDKKSESQKQIEEQKQDKQQSHDHHSSLQSQSQKKQKQKQKQKAYLNQDNVEDRLVEDAQKMGQKLQNVSRQGKI